MTSAAAMIAKKEIHGIEESIAWYESEIANGKIDAWLTSALEGEKSKLASAKAKLELLQT
jgi:hypothetical protein